MRNSSCMAVAAAMAFGVWSLAAQTALPKQEPPAAAAEYVGSEVCQACHENIFNAIAKSPHHAVDVSAKHGRQGQACEACHGPGSKHIEAADIATIRNPAKLKPADADRDCLACHLNQPTQIGRLQSGHARSQVACTSCHPVHSGALVTRKMADVNQQCSGCHIRAASEFQRPHAHRVAQGAASCTDCHNPHGSVARNSMRLFAANEPGCLKCHSDKRGPFAFEHAPMRLEGCGSCHEPHGSANPRMLTRAEVRNVCLECHANVATLAGPNLSGRLGGVPPSFHDLRSPRFRTCTTCHQKIHGSHVDRYFQR